MEPTRLTPKYYTRLKHLTEEKHTLPYYPPPHPHPLPFTLTTKIDQGCGGKRFSLFLPVGIDEEKYSFKTLTVTKR